MASISSITKTNFHARSISLPSRSTQITEFDGLQATTSSSSIGQQIDGLNNLYSSFANLLKGVQNEGVNELLDELLSLLELCSTARDALLMTRESAQQLQSVLRRKRGDSNELSSAIREYQSKRKAVKKAIVTLMRNLKGSSVKKIQETRLTEMQSLTLRVLESLLCFILGSISLKNSNKWSFVSKLVGQSDESSERSQVGKVDTELAKKSSCLRVENVQKEISQMELSLEDLQEGLESIYRNLIKTRVSLLNLPTC